MWNPFKTKPKLWREFACYIDPFMRNSQLAMELLRRANELGLAGKRITVAIRECKNDQGADEIWFEGELK